MKLELISRCAAAEGSAARYHLSFRLENVSEFAVDVKLAHLFAVQCQSPSLLNEMVCLLPLFGNSILSPYSSSAFDHQDDEEEKTSSTATTTEESSQQQNSDDDHEPASSDDENELTKENLKSVRRRRKQNAKQDAEEEVEEVEGTTTGDKHIEEPVSEAPHHEFVRKMKLRREQEQQQISKETQHASLPYINHSKSSNRTSPAFSAKPKAPDHCAVYDVSFPVQGECVLRGFILYRTLSNSYPSASSASSDSNNNLSENGGDGRGGSGEAQNSTSMESEGSKIPSTVKSRLKVLHLPLIKLSPPDS